MIGRLVRSPGGEWGLEFWWTRAGVSHTDIIWRNTRAEIDGVIRTATQEDR